MSVRQYIGARYVPQFFDNAGSTDWVSGIAYEPFTVVTYLNDSYTSKKPVPSTVGAPNLNLDYWACTGNFNAQLSTLSTQVTNMGITVNNLDANLGSAKLVMIESTFDQVNATDSKIAEKIIQHSALDPLGISVDKSVIVGVNGFNHASNSWWSNDLYPGVYQHLKTTQYPLSVENLAAGASTDIILSTGGFTNVTIVGWDVRWDTYNVLDCIVVTKTNPTKTYANITNWYNATLSDTGTITIFYLDDTNEPLAKSLTDTIGAKLRVDSGGHTYLQVQSMLRSQYDVGDKFRIALMTFSNIVQI